VFGERASPISVVASSQPSKTYFLLYTYFIRPTLYLEPDEGLAQLSNFNQKDHLIFSNSAQGRYTRVGLEVQFILRGILCSTILAPNL